MLLVIIVKYWRKCQWQIINKLTAQDFRKYASKLRLLIETYFWIRHYYGAFAVFTFFQSHLLIERSWLHLCVKWTRLKSRPHSISHIYAPNSLHLHQKLMMHYKKPLLNLKVTSQKCWKSLTQRIVTLCLPPFWDHSWPQEVLWVMTQEKSEHCEQQKWI